MSSAPGRSANRLPLAPTQSHGGAQTMAAGANGHDDVEITVNVGADPQGVANAYGATLRGNASWRCATLIPGGTQTADGLIAQLVVDSRVETAEKVVVAETGDALTYSNYIEPRRQAALRGDIYKPRIAFQPLSAVDGEPFKTD